MSAGVWVWKEDFRNLWERSGRYLNVKLKNSCPARNGCRWNETESACLLAGYLVEQKSLPSLAHRHQRGANAIAIQMDRLQTAAMTQPTRPLLERLARCGLLTQKETEMADPVPNFLADYGTVLQAYAEGRPIEFQHPDTGKWHLYTPVCKVALPDPAYGWRVQRAVQTARMFMVPSKITAMGAAFLHDPNLAPNLELQFIDNKLVGATVL